jgi:hypothetical protein
MAKLIKGKASAKQKPVVKKALVGKKTTLAKKTMPAKKQEPRKKPIGFEMMKSFQTSIEGSFEKLQKSFDECSEILNEYVYEGKKKNAALTRALLMEITKEAKTLRNIIQEAKTKLKPIYKS